MSFVPSKDRKDLKDKRDIRDERDQKDIRDNLTTFFQLFAAQNVVVVLGEAVSFVANILQKSQCSGVPPQL